MTTAATGRVIPTEKGRDLILVRSLALPAEETWAYLTDPQLTEEWFGPWDGDGRAGGSVRIRMRFEEGEPASRARIVGCDAPSYLALQVADEYGSWNLELFVDADGDEDSVLRFVHHLDDDADVGEVGPGWEYYLDLLVAATEGTEQSNFDQYYPEMSAYFRDQE